MLKGTHFSILCNSPRLFGIVKVSHEHIGPSDTNFPLAICTEVLHFWDVSKLNSRASDWWAYMVRTRVSLDRQGTATRALGLTIPIKRWTKLIHLGRSSSDELLPVCRGESPQIPTPSTNTLISVMKLCKYLQKYPQTRAQFCIFKH